MVAVEITSELCAYLPVRAEDRLHGSTLGANVSSVNKGGARWERGRRSADLIGARRAGDKLAGACGDQVNSAVAQSVSVVETISDDV